MNELSELNVFIPPKILPLFDPKYAKIDKWIIYGGRDLGKSANFAIYEMLAAIKRVADEKTGRILACRSVQRNIENSVLAELKKAAALYPKLAEKFRIGRKFMRTEEVGVDFEFMGTNINPIGLKGVEGVFLSFLDEADAATKEALEFLKPTVRAEGGKLLFGFNPTFLDTPMAKQFLQWIDGACGRDAEQNLYRSFVDYKRRLGVIFGTYRDNPFLSETSARRILDEKRDMDEDDFANIYDGRFVSLSKSAYYGRALRLAEQEGRLGDYPFNPNLQTHCSWDLGRNDMMAVVVWQPIWDYQNSVFWVNVVDFFTGTGYGIDFYAAELQRCGYDRAKCWLPHDGAAIRGYTETQSADERLRDFGFKTEIILNQGEGAAYKRIVDTRTMFRRISFNTVNQNLAPLMESLRNYAPKIVNNLPSNTPDHKYSDAADAFGILPYAIKNMNFANNIASAAAPLDRNKWGAGL